MKHAALLEFRKRGTNTPRSLLQALLRTMSSAEAASNEISDLLAEEILAILRRPGYAPLKGKFDFFPQFLHVFSCSHSARSLSSSPPEVNAGSLPKLHLLLPYSHAVCVWIVRVNICAPFFCQQYVHLLTNCMTFFAISQNSRRDKTQQH